MSNREKDRFTAAVPSEVKTRLDEVAEARGTHRSGAVVQVVQEWDEQADEIERLRAEVDRLRDELAEKRADEDDDTPGRRRLQRLQRTWLGRAVVATVAALVTLALTFLSPVFSTGAWAVVGAAVSVVGVVAWMLAVTASLAVLAYLLAFHDMTVGEALRDVLADAAATPAGGE